MEFKIAIHSDQKYVEIVTSGFLDKDNSVEMAKLIAKKMRRHRLKKALVDHRNISGVSGKIVDVYLRPKLFRVIGVILGLRIAEVINPEHTEHFRFLETVFMNQGYKFKIFYDRQDALEWLLD